MNALAWSRDLKLFFQCVGSGELEVRRQHLLLHFIMPAVASRGPDNMALPAECEPASCPPSYKTALQVYSYPEMKRLRGLHGHTAGVYGVALDKQDK